MPTTITRRIAFAAITLVIATGCTTEESSSGCSVMSPTGFTGTSKSELAVGDFTYKPSCAADQPCQDNYAKPVPAALGQGATFSLTFKKYGDPPVETTLRSAASDGLVLLTPDEDTSAARFSATKPGVFVVLATSAKNPTEVVDLIHVRVIAPTKIVIDPGFTFLTESQLAAIEKGNITIEAGQSQTFNADVWGVVDEANGPIPDVALGGEVKLEGVSAKWATSDAKVVSLDPGPTGVRVLTLKEGKADVTLTAAQISKVVHVTVTKAANNGY